MKVAVSYISAQIPSSLLPWLRWSTPGTFRFWSSAILVLRTQHNQYSSSIFSLKDAKGVDTSHPHRKLTLFHTLPVDATAAITLAAGGEWRSRKQGRKGYSLLAHPCIRPWYGLYMIGPWRFWQGIVWFWPITRLNRCSTFESRSNDFLFLSRQLPIPYLLFWRPVWLQGCSGIPLQLPGRSYFFFSLSITI